MQSRHGWLQHVVAITKTSRDRMPRLRQTEEFRCCITSYSEQTPRQKTEEEYNTENSPHVFKRDWRVANIFNAIAISKHEEPQNKREIGSDIAMQKAQILRLCNKSSPNSARFIEHAFPRASHHFRATAHVISHQTHETTQAAPQADSLPQKIAAGICLQERKTKNFLCARFVRIVASMRHDVCQTENPVFESIWMSKEKSKENSNEG